MEDPSSSTDSDSSSLRNQRPKLHTGFMWTIDNSDLLEDLFTEGFLPHFNTPLTNLSDPIVTPVVPVLSSSIGGTFPSSSQRLKGRGIIETLLVLYHLPSQWSLQHR